MSLISDLAIDLRKAHGGSAPEWQQAIDAAGSNEQARWLLEHAWPRRCHEVAWTPGVLILAAAAARLLEAGPAGEQRMYATT